MSRMVTLELDDALLRGAEWIAHSSRRRVDDVLVDAIKATVPALSSKVLTQPVAQLSDDEVLARMRQPMPIDRDQRLSFLLDRQQARDLTNSEQAELAELMSEYQTLLLLSSEAAAEAGSRGILPPTPLKSKLPNG